MTASASRWWPLLVGVLLACRGAEGPPRHLVLVSIDTLRADRLGSYGSSRGLSPNADRLAGASVRFTTAYAAAPFTLASLCALMTGRYPEELGIVANPTVLPSTVPTLAGWLGTRGWRTGAVVSNFVLRPRSGINAGFVQYDATFPQREAVRGLPERTATATTSAAIAMLDRLTTAPLAPVFLWVHFQDPHGPYTPPGDLRERNLPAEQVAPDGMRRLPVSATDRGIGAIPRYQYQAGHDEAAFYRAGYDGEVEYLDHEVGRLLAAVEERLPPGETIVVFTADHGEGLGEDDYWFAHGEYLSDPLVRVPLLLRVPGRAPATRDDIVSLVDLFPTLVGLLGIEPPAGVRGRDLFAPGAAEAPGFAYLATLAESTVPRFGIVSGDARYVVSIEGGRSVDTITPVRGATAAADRGALAAELTSFRQALAVAPTVRQTLSPADRDRLRALGYLHDHD